MPSGLQALRDQIREAFPPTPFYGPITACSCDECKTIRESLRHQQWDQVPREFIEFTCSPVLLEPEAFSAFLPAYLLRALDDLVGDNVVLELTVYSLCTDLPDEDDFAPHEDSHPDELLLERAALMSPAQIAAIRAFLLFVVDHAARGDWFQQFVNPALESVWRAA